MHLVVPFAAPLSDAGAQALQGLELRNLAALLARLEPAGRDEGDEYQLSMPHERVLARAFGWAGADGALPWAARAAAADGLDTGDLAWGLLTPAHWQVGREHITMGDPDALGLDAAESRAFFDAVRGLFESLGWLTAWGSAERWYVAHESLAALPTASPDRVIGRDPDLWLPEDPRARPLKRLQSELQMLLHTHPLNAARQAAGKDALNSVWLSGCGLRQPERGAAPIVLDALRAPALREDWAAWRVAWRALDAGPLRAAHERVQAGAGRRDFGEGTIEHAAHRGLANRDAPSSAEAPFVLSLCGERHAQRYELRPRGALRALRARWAARPDARERLAAL